MATDETKDLGGVDPAYREQMARLRETSDRINAALAGPAYGITMIDDKPATSVRFERSEKDGQAAYTVSFHMGNKQVARVKNLDADTLGDVVGDKNAKAILEHAEAKGSLKGEDLQNEYGLTPEETARRTAEKEARKAADAEKMEPDAADEINKIEHTPERLEQIDIAEGLARAAQNRQRDREAWEAQQERLGLQAEGKRITVENLSEKAGEQQDANLLAERTGGSTDYGSQVDTEREKNRQAELMDQLHAQFRVAGPRFHFKDQPGKIAFKDKGQRMVSASNDERVARAMATMADAKGWKTITVSGHPDFRKEVWMEASLRGIEVRGYKPQEQDLRALEERRERQMHNAVEHDAERDRQKAEKAERAAERTKPEQGRPEPARKAAERAQEAPEDRGKGAAAGSAEKGATAAIRSYSGRVLEHGEAPYNHDPDEKTNYYVKLATAEGEKTVWGVDLKRAMGESKTQVGDTVKLDYLGNQPVTVQALKRDDKGKVIGSEPIETHRNTWEVQKTDRHKVVEALAAAVVDANVKNPAQREALMKAFDQRLQELAQAGKMPAVMMYDKAAPSKTQDAERTRPQVERNAERTR
ncbi:LPD7 domain-containing protein [Pseudomonas aeruginosa]|uniref:LPD7 domain-containing protein n=1 Tax=Pseudomonas aeruginosa TaxID=287 RepID=UPI0003BB44D9|nr:LPD7 domain-containing protein [Pseudomonas aeruginosa]ERZ10177.1 hypothetical protein Q007_06432 [Pseudomonas aeruginosa S54485]MCS8265489.1 hypothetical protein [Pseudomonas aeruginosa]RPO67828.1 hypothetical protein IPC1180_32650 [Pseudomonas aeruginosa]